MQKKLTITLDESVYKGLRNLAGRQGISRFIETLVQPRLSERALAAEYKAMAADEAAEAEALEWAEGTIEDVADETW
jgi:predicted CopG family antitoxin